MEGGGGGGAGKRGRRQSWRSDSTVMFLYCVRGSLCDPTTTPSFVMFVSEASKHGRGRPNDEGWLRQTGKTRYRSRTGITHITTSMNTDHTRAARRPRDQNLLATPCRADQPSHDGFFFHHPTNVEYSSPTKRFTYI